ncbi:uncharacterized protein LOC127245236 [Andrographis paniculata]|uniref:uncharacterized protein LOC127245236 n=1 Tax=Andrographis paniculata TaxID=175694 RepID=UPI0021E6EB67|nr:uncharacterized protein LOC127245236 [Andrographis paniculata]
MCKQMRKMLKHTRFPSKRKHNQREMKKEREIKKCRTGYSSGRRRRNLEEKERKKRRGGESNEERKKKVGWARWVTAARELDCWSGYASYLICILKPKGLVIIPKEEDDSGLLPCYPNYSSTSLFNKKILLHEENRRHFFIVRLTLS